MIATTETRKYHTPTLEDFFYIEPDPLHDEKNEMIDQWEREMKKLQDELLKLKRERKKETVRSLRKVLDIEIEEKKTEIRNWELVFSHQYGKGLEIQRELIRRWGWEHLFPSIFPSVTK